MKSIKSINGVIFLTLMSLLISGLTGWDPFYTFVGMLAFALFVPTPKGVAMMALQKEIWTRDIIGNLFKNNEWAARAFSADQYVLAGKVVHEPVAGTPSAVVKNLDTFPQAAVKRADTELTYPLDTFYSLPRHIEKIEQYELSYDKRQSCMGEDQAYLIQAAMDSLLYRWAPAAARTVLTTGAATPATVTGGTGNRKAFTKAEFASLKLLMDKENIPSNGRVAVLTADHYNQFFSSLSEAEKTDVGRVANMSEGVVGRYLGFDLYMRSTVLRYRGANGAYVVVDEQDAGFAASTKTGDRAASIFYYEKAVSRAKGDVDIFEDNGNPGYYGDVYSMLLRLGGRIRRAAAVYAVVEDLAS